MIYDVAVVGGGLVGSLSAILLGQLGYSVVLIEKDQPVRSSGDFGLDLRSIAVSPASKILLESAGIWGLLNPTPYKEMCVWEEFGASKLTFSSEISGNQELGFICENTEILEAMWCLLGSINTVKCMTGNVLEDLQVHSDCVTLSLGREQVSAKLLLGADGADSRVRTALRAETKTLATRHHVLATVVEFSGSHAGVAWQKFLPDGPIAVLPSSNAHVAFIVWSQKQEQAQRRKEQDGDGFCQELTVVLEARFGVANRCDHRVVFPVTQHLVKTFCPSPRVVLLGDAARVIHPLAGLGANVGFEDVAALIDILAVNRSVSDIGTLHDWKGFSKNRIRKSKLMIEAMSRLDNLYANTSPLFTFIRNKSIKTLDRNKFIKKRLILEAQGLGLL